MFTHAHIFRYFIYFICTYFIPKETLQPTLNQLQLDPKPTLNKNLEPTLQTPWTKPNLKKPQTKPKEPQSQP
jgi:hypothetical protein